MRVLSPAVGGSSRLPWEAGMWEKAEWERAWLFHLVYHCQRLSPARSHGGLALWHKGRLSATQNKPLPLRRANKTVWVPLGHPPRRPDRAHVSGSRSKNECEGGRQESSCLSSDSSSDIIYSLIRHLQPVTRHQPIRQPEGSWPLLGLSSLTVLKRLMTLAVFESILDKNSWIFRVTPCF